MGPLYPRSLWVYSATFVRGSTVRNKINLRWRLSNCLGWGAAFAYFSQPERGDGGSGRLEQPKESCSGDDEHVEIPSWHQPLHTPQRGKNFVCACIPVNKSPTAVSPLSTHLPRTLWSRNNRFSNLTMKQCMYGWRTTCVFLNLYKNVNTDSTLPQLQHK